MNNGQVVRDLYRAIQGADLARALALLADDVVFHIPGKGVNAGAWRGPGGVAQMLARMQEETLGSFRVELDDVLAGEGENVVALATYRATRRGASLENRLAHVVRVRDGRIVESWLCARDQYAVDAFWAA